MKLNDYKLLESVIFLYSITDESQISSLNKILDNL